MQTVRFFEKEVEGRDPDTGERYKVNKIHVEILNLVDGTVSGVERVATQGDFAEFKEAYGEYLKGQAKPVSVKLVGEAEKKFVKSRIFKRKEK